MGFNLLPPGPDPTLNLRYAVLDPNLTFVPPFLHNRKITGAHQGKNACLGTSAESQNYQ